MAIGDSAEIGLTSYLAVGKESTFGTYASATTAIDFLSSSLRVSRESRKIDSFGLTRGFTKRVSLGQDVGGTVEMVLHPEESVLFLAAAMGGSVTSAQHTTTIDGFYRHSISVGDFNTTGVNSLSINEKKGSKVWRYSGGRVNGLRIVANVGEPVMLTADMVFKDATQQSDDIESSLTMSAVLPFTFVQGSFRYAASESALTSTAAETVVGVEIGISNGFKTDADVRALGSRIPSVIPPTRRSIELKVRQRFDTTTAYNRFLADTAAAAQVVFEGSAITASGASNYTVMLTFPKVIPNSPDPTLTGPNDVIMQEIDFDVMVDTMTSAGRDIGITVFNGTSAY